MRTNVTSLITVVVLVSIIGSACSGSARSKDLSALDQAYKTGVLNKDEYEAKKAALVSQAQTLEALDKALARGAMTQADYQAAKAQLIARAGSLATFDQARAVPVAPTAVETATPAPVDPLPQPAPAASAPNDRPISAPSGLKSINPPEGGQIVYGQVEGQSSEAGAMGAVLRSLHNQLGERPQVGRLFQVHGTQSVAAFFSVRNKNQGGGQIAGLIIVAKATSDHVEAALVSDDAARFPKTLSPLMMTLFGAWHPLRAVAGNSGSGSNAPAPIHQVTLADRSASVGLPDGWKIVPAMSQMGTIVATGPKDESAELGITFLASDTNNPRVQQTLQTLRNGGLRNTSYAKAIYYPYGADMSKTFVYLMQDLRRRAGLPQASYTFSSVSPVPGPPQERCAHMPGTVDLGDGEGPRELNVMYCTTPPTPAAGAWLSVAYMTTAPIQVAAAERATLGAILQSFNVNQGVVNAQAARLAAPVIDQIHAIGRAAANQAAAAHERNEIQNSSVYKRWDDNDKRSQEFENYQLGYAVLSDSEHTAHGTFTNEDAEALVKSNPERFEYVSAPDYWKGIDY